MIAGEAQNALVKRLQEEGHDLRAVTRKDGHRDLYLGRIRTPKGLDDIWVSYRGIDHLSRNRSAARERYIDYALATFRHPSEVWLREILRRGQVRYSRNFLGRFEDGTSIIAVDRWDGGNDWLLWTYYPAHKDEILKNLSKFRRGTLLWRRAPNPY